MMDKRTQATVVHAAITVMNEADRDRLTFVMIDGRILEVVEVTAAPVSEETHNVMIWFKEK